MATMNQAREAIYAAFITGWTTDSPAPGDLRTPIARDNEAYDPSAGTPYVRLAVRHIGRSQRTLGKAGNRKYGSLGAAFVQVFVPVNTGTKAADDLAKAAQDIFEGVTLAAVEVSFLDVTVRETGPSGKWFGVTVQADFDYEEIK